MRDAREVKTPLRRAAYSEPNSKGSGSAVDGVVRGLSDEAILGYETELVLSEHLPGPPRRPTDLRPADLRPADFRPADRKAAPVLAQSSAGLRVLLNAAMAASAVMAARLLTSAKAATRER